MWKPEKGIGINITVTAVMTSIMSAVVALIPSYFTFGVTQFASGFTQFSLQMFLLALLLLCSLLPVFMFLMTMIFFNVDLVTLMTVSVVITMGRSDNRNHQKH